MTFSIHDILMAILLGITIVVVPIGLGLLLIKNKSNGFVLTQAQTLLLAYLYGVLWNVP